MIILNVQDNFIIQWDINFMLSFSQMTAPNVKANVITQPDDNTDNIEIISQLDNKNNVIIWLDN